MDKKTEKVRKGEGPGGERGGREVKEGSDKKRRREKERRKTWRQRSRRVSRQRGKGRE